MPLEQRGGDPLQSLSAALSAVKLEQAALQGTSLGGLVRCSACRFDRLLLLRVEVPLHDRSCAFPSAALVLCPAEDTGGHDKAQRPAPETKVSQRTHDAHK